MSLHLYSIYYPDQFPPAFYQSLLDRLPISMQQKILRYRRWQDAYGSLLGKLLLELAVKKAGLRRDLNGLRVSAYGRPNWVGGPDFNISHSGTRVVCVLSLQGRVGIDLEACADLSISDFQSQFTAAEWAAITGSETPLLTFYHYWTAKESLIKADGRGLQIPLVGLEIGGGMGEAMTDGGRWYLHELDLFPGYACHIASETPIEILTCEEVSPDMF
jgi:4'-phosphopantetheinyl transferase